MILILQIIFSVISKVYDDRILIEVYGESLCPDTIRFLMRSFKKAVYAQDIDKIANIKLYNYGKAQQKWNNDQNNWSFFCHHGQNECFGNQIMTCTMNYANYLKFSICMHEQGFKNIWKVTEKDWQQIVPQCAQQFDIELTHIQYCMDNHINLAYHQVGVQTESQQILDKHIPWINVNSIHNDEFEFAIIADMLGFICLNYQGPNQIDACKKYKKININTQTQQKQHKNKNIQERNEKNNEQLNLEKNYDQYEIDNINADTFLTNFNIKEEHKKSLKQVKKKLKDKQSNNKEMKIKQYLQNNEKNYTILNDKKNINNEYQQAQTKKIIQQQQNIQLNQNIEIAGKQIEISIQVN